VGERELNKLKKAQFMRRHKNYYIPHTYLENVKITPLNIPRYIFAIEKVTERNEQ
jgi:hypothetical protein